MATLGHGVILSLLWFLCQKKFFNCYQVNASENGDFNRGRKSFHTECYKNGLEWQRKFLKIMDLHDRKWSGITIFVSSSQL